MLPWQQEFQSNQLKKIMQPFPQPDDALNLIKIGQMTLEKYFIENVNGGQRTINHSNP